jgi:deoxyadenosine/deoxycytidine kinase
MGSNEDPFRPYREHIPPGARWLRMLAGHVIVLEGPIASGKSSMGAALAAYLNARGREAVFMPERFPEDVLRDFIEWDAAHAGDAADAKAPNPYAFSLQMGILEQRAETYALAQSLAARGCTVLVDRSLPGDYVFARVNHERGNMTHEQWAQYKEKLRAVDTLEPTAILFLDVSVDTSLRRIRARARTSEDKYPRDYLAHLDRVYRQVLASYGYPMVTLAWDRDLPPPSGGGLVIPDEQCKRVLLAVQQLVVTDRDGMNVMVV